MIQDILNGRRTVMVLLAIFSLLLAGQLIAQLYTVRQLHKVSGKVIGKETKKTGYSSDKYNRAQYSLILTLDDQQFDSQPYTVDLDKSNWNIDDQISVNDYVTIYCPTTAYNLLSLDCLDFGSRVSQVEKRGQILSSFRHRQNKLWTLSLCLFVAVLLFSYKLYQLQANDESE
jgi:hypothetical protein